MDRLQAERRDTRTISFPPEYLLQGNLAGFLPKHIIAEQSCMESTVVVLAAQCLLQHCSCQGQRSLGVEFLKECMQLFDIVDYCHSQLFNLIVALQSLFYHFQQGLF